MVKIPTVFARNVKVFRAEDTPDYIIKALENEIASMTEPFRAIYPEYTVITVARAVAVPERDPPQNLPPVPAGSRGTIVHVHGAGEAYEVEFSEPWQVVTVRREDIVLDLPLGK